MFAAYPFPPREVADGLATPAAFGAWLTELAGRYPDVRGFVVGNEPNQPAFWRPQFARAAQVSAASFGPFLAAGYDSLKAVGEDITVVGVGLSPRGNDRPAARSNVSTSPIRFLAALGAWYRASGRTRPLMDALAFHPYGQSSSDSPDTLHPLAGTIGPADYSKLVALLGEAFDGTPQPGSKLPVLYDAVAFETKVAAAKTKVYTGDEPTATKPVDEATQAAFYRRALELAFCQPTVAGILLFHSQDEKALLSWQSGVYYADGTPKSSFWAVRDSLSRVRGGSIARCEGMALDVAPAAVRFPGQAAFARGVRDVWFRCPLDCAWTLEAVRTSGAVAATARGWSRAGRVVASLGAAKLGASPVRLRLTVVHPVNPGTPATVTSGVLRAG